MNFFQDLADVLTDLFICLSVCALVVFIAWLTISRIRRQKKSPEEIQLERFREKRGEALDNIFKESKLNEQWLALREEVKS
ncbi:MAG: hypothetical protein WC715_00255 [Patescibacteria group bacterium]|jgi:hypothetical protein